jgi:hypothetical protein
MSQRRCRFCQRDFEASRFHPEQAVCSEPSCQRRRRQENRRQKLASDPEYRQVCCDSARKWRARHSDYWSRYRTSNPDSVERNRLCQQQRDLRRQLAHLANNNSARQVKSFMAEVWWLGPGSGNLANNNLAPSKLLVVEPVGSATPAPEAACKQQLFGSPPAFA